jgi:hypothetical protein
VGTSWIKNGKKVKGIMSSCVPFLFFFLVAKCCKNQKKRLIPKSVRSAAAVSFARSDIFLLSIHDDLQPSTDACEIEIVPRQTPKAGRWGIFFPVFCHR